MLLKLRQVWSGRSKFATEIKQPVPPPKPVVSSKPKKNFSAKGRNKFIDSSSASDTYDSNISDAPSEMFTDYSRPKKQDATATAWKQTLITFLLLSLLTLAGYIYYVLKYQPLSIGNLPEQIEEFGTASDDSGLDGDEDISVDQEEVLDTQAKASVNENRQVEHAPDVTQKRIETQTLPPKNKEPIKKTEPPKEEIVETKPVDETPKVEPSETVSVVPPPVAPKMEERVPANTNAQTETADSSSFSDTALKDIDELLAKKTDSKQRVPQESSMINEIAERPQVAVYDFKIFYQRSRKMLIAKFKIARTKIERNLVQGRLFVVFKPRQSSQIAKFFSHSRCAHHRWYPCGTTQRH